MKNKVIFAGVGLGILALLYGCGGGGGDPTAITTTTTSTTTTTTLPTYPEVKPTQGDTLTYSQVNTIGNTTQPTINVTRYYKIVNNDGSVTYTNTIDNPTYVGNTQVFATDGGLLSTANFGNVGNNCTYAPSFAAPNYPLYVGQSLNATAVQTCVNGGTTTFFDVVRTGSYAALESVTTAAGTFSALKQVTTTIATSRTDGSKTKTDQTSWLDTVLGRTVKYAITISTAPAGSSSFTLSRSQAISLVKYNISGKAGSVADPIVYAGGWTATYAGTDSGSCSSITVSDTGTLTGNCTSNANGAFTISGSVNAQGTINFNAVGGFGGTFTGTLNPVTGTGTWSNGPDSGTWNSTHK